VYVVGHDGKLIFQRQAALTTANVNTYYSGTTPKAAPDLPAVNSYLTSYVPSSS
jgi:hypothetical protein